MIPKRERKIILEILRPFVKMGYEFSVFGSRVKREARKDSDLDLLVERKAKLCLADMARLREEFEESDLGYRVDLVARDQLSEEMFQAIRPSLLRL